MRTLRNLLRESSWTQGLGTGIRFWMNNERFISFSFRFIERRNFLSQRRARILKAPGRTAHYVRLMYAYRYIWYAFRLCCRSGSVRTTGRDNMYERFSERCAPDIISRVPPCIDVVIEIGEVKVIVLVPVGSRNYMFSFTNPFWLKFLQIISVVLREFFSQLDVLRGTLCDGHGHWWRLAPP